jgi:hypothetical protein
MGPESTGLTEATAATLRQVVGDVRHLATTFQEAQSTITKVFSDSTDVYTANNLLTAAQADVSMLSQAVTTQTLLLHLTPLSNQADFRADLQKLQEQLAAAKTLKDQRAAEVIALKAAQRPLPAIASSLLLSQASSSSVSHKRPRLHPDESVEEREVLQMAVSSMEVDHQVRSITQGLIHFFHFFSPLLDSLATRVNLLLEALQTCVVSKVHVRPPSIHPSFCLASLTSLHSVLLFSLIFIFFSFLPSVHAFPGMNPPLLSPVLPFSSMSFCTVSINANGFSNPMKIQACHVPYSRVYFRPSPTFSVLFRAPPYDPVHLRVIPCTSVTCRAPP